MKLFAFTIGLLGVATAGPITENTAAPTWKREVLSCKAVETAKTCQTAPTTAVEVKTCLTAVVKALATDSTCKVAYSAQFAFLKTTNAPAANNNVLYGIQVRQADRAVVTGSKETVSAFSIVPESDGGNKLDGFTTVEVKAGEFDAAKLLNNPIALDPKLKKDDTKLVLTTADTHDLSKIPQNLAIGPIVPNKLTNANLPKGYTASLTLTYAVGKTGPISTSKGVSGIFAVGGMSVFLVVLSFM